MRGNEENWVEGKGVLVWWFCFLRGRNRVLEVWMVRV